MQKLHPLALWLFILRSIGGIVFFIVLGGYLVRSGYVSLPTAIIGVILIAIFYIIFAILSYQNYRYEFTTEGFKKEYGVIYKRYVSIPYERIQNIDVHQGIIARLLGLADLQIQTAGSSAFGMAEGRLPGLSMNEAQRLREELLTRMRTTRSGTA